MLDIRSTKRSSFQKCRTIPRCVPFLYLRIVIHVVRTSVAWWEKEITPCEHTLTLVSIWSVPLTPFPHVLTCQVGLAHCGFCDLKENLWLCLTCGSLGCGRQQFGGVGGNEHGLAHFETSGHGISVKFGTILRKRRRLVSFILCFD